MKRILWFLGPVLFMAAIVVTALYLNDQQRKDSSELGFMTGGTDLNNVIPMIWNGVAMIAGIVFGYFCNRFTDLRKAGTDQINIGREFGHMFKATSFYLALAASPIVFGIVVITAKGVSFGAALFLAFQNGFFWQNVMPNKPAKCLFNTHYGANPDNKLFLPLGIA